MGMSRKSFILDLGLGFFHDSTVRMASNLEENKLAQKGLGDRTFWRIVCLENDALGDQIWLNLGKLEKGMILGDHLLVDQCVSLGRMDSMVNMREDIWFLIKEASRPLR